MARGVRRSALVWSILGSLGFLVLPWYALPDGFFGFGWPARMLADRDLAPAVLQAVKFRRPWLFVPGVVLVAVLVVIVKVRGVSGLRKTRQTVQADLALLKRDDDTPARPAVEAG